MTVTTLTPPERVTEPNWVGLDGWDRPHALHGGPAELFLLPGEGGGIAYHLATLPHGAVILPVAATAAGSRIVLECHAGARLETLGAVEADAGAAVLGPGLAETVTGLCRYLARSDGRQVLVPLSAVGPVELKEGQRLGSMNELVVVRSQEASLALPSLDLDRGPWFLADGLTADVTRGGAAEVLAFDRWAAGGGRVEHVARFVDRTLRAAEGYVAELEQDERGRLRDRSERRARAVRAAFGALAAGAGQPLGGPPVAAAGDPLLAACMRLGREQKIAFRPPPDWVAERAGANRLAAICESSGVRHRKVLLRGRWWEDDHGPLLGSRLEDEGPVALLREGDDYVVEDPVTGRRDRVDGAVSETLAPGATQFYRPLPEEAGALWGLIRFSFDGVGGDLRTLVLAAVLAGLASMVLPFATGLVFGSVIPSASLTELGGVFIGLLAMALATAAFDLTRAYTTLRVEGRSGGIMQAAVFDRLLRLPAPFFREFSVGDLVSRVSGLERVRSILLGSVVASLMAGLAGLFNLVTLFYYDRYLASRAVLMLAAGLLVLTVLGYMVARLQYQVQTIGGRLSGFTLQLILGIAKLRVAGAEERAFARWADDYAEKVRLRRRTATIEAVSTAITDLLPLLVSLGVFWLVGRQAAATGRLIDTSHFIGFLAALGVILAAGTEVSNTAINIMQIGPLLRRAKPVLQAEPEVSVALSDPGPLMGQIEAHDIRFGYLPDTPVLDGVSFQILPREYVAFVGPSGAGKSTILRALLGFERLWSGGVYYDGQNLAEVDAGAVRRQMGVVLQTSRIMAGDILSNILGTHPLTEDDAWEAAAMAGFADDIKAMPMGMQTIISEGGGAISGGQRQRLLIARALVHKPRILLFDEATSALDNRTQRIVTESLDRLHATRIVIAHRLSTIRSADRIYMIVDGKIVEEGDFDALMILDGRFARLVARQTA